MRLYEVIADYVLDSFIFEQALRRREVESTITNLSTPILKHLVKVLKWQDEINYNKHIGDINGWLFDVQRMYIKGNKKPTQTDYYQWLFAEVIRDEITLERMIRGLHNYHELPVLRTDDEVFNIIKAVMYQISYDLVLNKFDDIRDYLPGPMRVDDR